MFTFPRHQYSAVGHIFTHSINLAFGPQKINDRFGLQNEARLQPWAACLWYAGGGGAVHFLFQQRSIDSGWLYDVTFRDDSETWPEAYKKYAFK